MFNKPKVAVRALVVLAFASTASAKDSEPPTIDLQETCSVTEKATLAVFGNSINNENNNIFERCVANEQASRQQLVKDWATYSAADKALCMQPKVYQPSYSEWLTCAEMQRDVRKMRLERKAESPSTSNQSSARRSRAGTNRCPIVQYGADGAMVSAIACARY
jgi:hypothetical protein